MRHRSRLGLIAGAWLAAGPAVAGPEFAGSYDWHRTDRGFGGFSAIEVDASGKGFVALTDRGNYVSGRLIRDAAGRVTDIEAGPVAALRGKGTEPLAAGRRDSEGLAIAPDGRVCVSFEDPARVLCYESLGAGARNLPSPREFAGLPANRQLEALAVDGDGTLYALPEQTSSRAGAFPVWRYRGGKWDMPLALTRDGDFLPVAADVGPDGALYVLERDFAGLKGMRSRIRRLDLHRRGTQTGEILLLTGYMTHGNLEGLSVWRDGAGRLRATMIADDGFQFFLSTQIVEYRLDG